ncbi:NitT/TauT family transport system substrate-binding protein [Paenibacillus sp. 1_12]|uniref:ABC transporter substrate-binding protein n=1 Tax=Paenibacillus sp. 1_12 TaxID=1566278 RepID=UPI0008EA22A1|nr:ABC transporter substrate-binding protein [Paenibacillus sp. 1_12]SFK73578.1 NitT/TauT family transport system substrate-binding protein [Paenibacillus sp. 1_12]
MKIGKNTNVGASVLISFGLLLAGCGTADKPTAQPTAPKGNEQQASAPAPAKLPKVNIMVGGLEKIIYLPAKLTENLGYFKEEGLEVELTSQASGVNAEQALIAGEVQGVVGFYDHTIDIQAKGKYLQEVVQLATNPGAKLMVANKVKDQIKGIADLKGRNIGITSSGASSHFLVNYLVTKGGNSTKDYAPLAVGAGATLVAAMEQGKVDVAWATQPTTALLEQRGIASVFVDLESQDGAKQALGGTYPAPSLYMSEDYVKKNPEVVQRLANAFVKTLRYMNTHKAEEIAEKVPKEYYAGDKDLYIKSLQSSLSMFTSDGKMPVGGPEKVLEILTVFTPQLKDAKIDLSKTFTNEFVDKVKK